MREGPTTVRGQRLGAKDLESESDLSQNGYGPGADFLLSCMARETSRIAVRQEAFFFLRDMKPDSIYRASCPTHTPYQTINKKRDGEVCGTKTYRKHMKTYRKPIENL